MHVFMETSVNFLGRFCKIILNFEQNIKLIWMYQKETMYIAVLLRLCDSFVVKTFRRDSFFNSYFCPNIQALK